MKNGGSFHSFLLNYQAGYDDVRRELIQFFSTRWMFLGTWSGYGQICHQFHGASRISPEVLKIEAFAHRRFFIVSVGQVIV